MLIGRLCELYLCYECCNVVAPAVLFFYVFFLSLLCLFCFLVSSPFLFFALEPPKDGFCFREKDGFFGSNHRFVQTKMVVWKSSQRKPFFLEQKMVFQTMVAQEPIKNHLFLERRRVFMTRSPKIIFFLRKDGFEHKSTFFPRQPKNRPSEAPAP